LLDQADGLWREESLVHQDVRWDNCIVVVEPGGAGPARLKLVDWELASKGDPAWDVASVFSEHLASWVLSVPVMGDTQLGSWPELARFPLKRIQPAIHSFWDAYRRRRRFDLAEHDGVLLRSTRFVAARLLQTAIEQTQSSSHLTGFAVLAVQLALNILRHPDRAARQLLGLKLSRALRS
jgi:aminoglycoside phosphotransferase (APT) family kinase protein